MTKQERVLAWLSDAYAMERELIPILENHANDVKDNPEMNERILKHKHETEQHAEWVKEALERLGGNASSIKGGIGTMMGKVAGASTGAFKDELIKNVLTGYSAEHFEIAAYESLKAAATELGDSDTAAMCDKIIPQEEAMAEWLKGNIEKVTQKVLNANE